MDKLSFKEWLKTREAAVPYVGQSAGCCGFWQGAPRGKPEPLSSVGNVKNCKKKCDKR
jgi:hypothetical protein